MGYQNRVLRNFNLKFLPQRVYLKFFMLDPLNNISGFCSVQCKPDAPEMPKKAMGLDIRRA